MYSAQAHNTLDNCSFFYLFLSYFQEMGKLKPSKVCSALSESYLILLFPRTVIFEKKIKE